MERIFLKISEVPGVPEFPGFLEIPGGPEILDYPGVRGGGWGLAGQFIFYYLYFIRIFADYFDCYD